MKICRREARKVRHGRVPAGAVAAGIADQAMARWHFPAGPGRQAGERRPPSRMEGAHGGRRLRLALIW